MVLRGRDSLVLLGDSASAVRRRDQIADFRLSRERQVGFPGSLSKRALSKGHPHQRGLSSRKDGNRRAANHASSSAIPPPAVKSVARGLLSCFVVVAS